MFRKKSKDNTSGSRRASLSEDEIIRSMWSKPDDAVLSRIQQQIGALDQKDITACPELFLKKNADYCQAFMRNIVPRLSNQELFNLTSSLMQAHISTRQPEPLLRGTDLLSGTLYVELAKRCGYDPLNKNKNALPIMDALNHYVFKSVCDVMGYSKKSHEEMNDKDIALRNGSVASVIIVKLGANEVDTSQKLTPELAKKLLEIDQRNREVGKGNQPDITDPIINERVTGDYPYRIPDNYNYNQKAAATEKKPWQETPQPTTPKEQTPGKFSLGSARKLSADKGKQESQPDKQAEPEAQPARKQSQSALFQPRQPQNQDDKKPEFQMGSRKKSSPRGSGSE